MPFSVKSDLWVGVTSAATRRFYDTTAGLRTPLQEETIIDGSKYYADGDVFDPWTSFNFEYGSRVPGWTGPCLYLKSTSGYKGRDTECSRENAYACIWSRE